MTDFFRFRLMFALLALWSASSDAASISTVHKRLFTENMFTKIQRRANDPPCPPQMTSLSSTAITCKRILDANPEAPSGTYTITTNSGHWIQIYCEMGLNGGGYTFLTPMSLTSLTDSEISTMFTDRTTFLLRVRKTNGTQPYAVLSQLHPDYSSIPLKLSLSNHDGYNPPINKLYKALDPPYLYFGFLPIANASNNHKQGIMINGYRLHFRNCDANPNSQFTLYTNFKEAAPTTYAVPNKFCDILFSRLLPNPSGRVIPSEFFFFGETTWGGCGCYQQTNQFPDITGFTIGFR